MRTFRRRPGALERTRPWFWVAVAVLMYATGRPQARRASLRGLLSMAVARVLSLLPPSRGRHADEAAAGAFVTAAALEIPATAALGLAELALNYDNHDDIPERLGAVAFGAGIAAASTRLWPVPGRLGPVAPKVWLPEHAEPNEYGEGLTIVANSESGNGDGLSEVIEELREAFPKAEIVEIEMHNGDEMRKVLDEAVGNGAVALGVVGGDGSINVAAQVAIESQRALMVVPGGTLNHLATGVGVETVADAVEAVKSGEAAGIDVATIDGKVFLNTASFGSYVALVDARERLEGRIGKWPAVVVALIRVLRKAEPVEVEIDGEKKKIWMAFIGNCHYRPSGFAPAWRERLDDRKIDFRYVSGDEPWSRTRLVAAVLTGLLGRSKVYSQDVVEELHLRSTNGPLRLARDGETFEGSEEIVVEKLEKRLAVYVPQDRKP